MHMLLAFSRSSTSIRINHELYSLYDKVDVVQCIQMPRMRSLRQVVRLDENAPARKVFYGNVGRGRPSLRYKDQVLADL